MARKADKPHWQTEQATVRVKSGLVKAMMAKKRPWMPISHIWSTAAQLFLALPQEVSNDLLTERRSIQEVAKALEAAEIVAAADAEAERAKGRRTRDLGQPATPKARRGKAG